MGRRHTYRAVVITYFGGDSSTTYGETRSCRVHALRDAQWRYSNLTHADYFIERGDGRREPLSDRHIAQADYMLDRHLRERTVVP